jgi:hypothetical protein
VAHDTRRSPGNRHCVIGMDLIETSSYDEPTGTLP